MDCPYNSNIILSHNIFKTSKLMLNMDFSGVKTRLGLLDEARRYFRPGLMVDGIEILNKIGEGGMGLIYRGTDQEDNLVALKVIAGLDQDGSSELRDRYRREVHTMNMVHGKHPIFPDIERYGEHIIQEDFMEIKYPTITMPLYHGRNLSQAKIDHPFSYVEAICRVLEGLDILHKNEILHRDIKPENIFLTWADEIILLDYGIAKGKFLKNLTKDHDRGIVGTLNYMAPEQFSEGSNEIDQRTDIYGAGMCLYILMTQNPRPIPGNNPAALFKNMIEKELPKVSDSLPDEWAQFSDDVSDIDHIISKMMAPDITHRFSSAQETLEALEPYRPGHINKYVAPLDLRSLVPEAQNKKISDKMFSQIVKKRYGEVLWLSTDLEKKLTNDSQILVFLPDRVKSVALKKDNWLIGRDKNQCDIVVFKNEKGTSRTHALAEKTQDGYKLMDLKSSNGTFLGGCDGPNTKFVRCSNTSGDELKPLQWVKFGGTVRRFVPADNLRPIILRALTVDDDVDFGATNKIDFE